MASRTYALGLAIYVLLMPQSAPFAQTVDPSELEALQSRLKDQTDKRDALSEQEKQAQAELDRLRKELVQAASKVRESEDAVGEAEAKLRGLRAAEGFSLAKLESREDELASLLVALSRLDRSPPPALAVSPDDARSALRGAMLMQSVIPELQEEAKSLRTELDELTRLRAEIVNAKSSLANATEEMDNDRDRLADLIKRKETERAALNEEMKRQQAKIDQLAGKATTLNDLIASLQSDAAQRIPLARPAPPPPRSKVTAHPPSSDEPTRKPPKKEPQVASLGPSPSSSNATANMLPVSGHIVQQFGDATGAGQKSAGIAIVTRPRAQVVSPASGKVEFAGPFRDYGQLLILEAAGGYHILLAGMEEITAEVGERLLRGEPVGKMGNDAAAASLVAVDLATEQGSRPGDSDPLLYLEVRKAGVAENPEIWLADNRS